MKFQLIVAVFIICFSKALAGSICDTRNCDCKSPPYIECGCFDSQIFPASGLDLSNIPSQLDHFTVSNCSLVNLKTDFFRNTNIRTAVFKSIQWVQLANFSFGNAPALKITFFSQSHLNATTNSFGRFSAERVTFANCTIGKFELDSFVETSLLSLIIDNSIVHEVHTDAFAKLIVDNVIISNSKLNIIPRWAIRFLYTLSIKMINCAIQQTNDICFSFYDLPRYHASLEISNCTFYNINGRLVDVNVFPNTMLTRFTFVNNLVMRASDLIIFNLLDRQNVSEIDISSNTFLQIGIDFPEIDYKFRYNTIKRNKFRCDHKLCNALRHSFPIAIGNSGLWSNFERMLLNESSCLPNADGFELVYGVYSRFLDSNECVRKMAVLENTI